MNKKGFTLIELLAVIVILAIIALIVTPVVSNIISSARTAADARSVEGHIKNIEYAVIEKAFQDGTGDLSVYDKLTSDAEVKATATLPANDNIVCTTLTIENGTVTSATGCKVGDKAGSFKYAPSTGAVAE